MPPLVAQDVRGAIVWIGAALRVSPEELAVTVPEAKIQAICTGV